MVTLFRVVILMLVAGLMSSCAQPPSLNAFEKAWQRYLALFYDNGRIMDTGNGFVSHSEGQGYGMLFAVAANDKATFDQLWKWTQQTLQREDSLFHWRYTPCPEADKSCISDPNNASDGDLLISWALVRAAQQWDEPVYRDEAQRIVAAIESKLIVTSSQMTLLLPGEAGFMRSDNDLQLNLSYWIFPALEALSRISDSPTWDALYQTGLRVIKSARFSDVALPPDWVRLIDGKPVLTDTLSQEFGFNACRIPLHLAWAGEINNAQIEPFLAWWRQEQVPATINLETGERASYAATLGMQAVERAVKAILTNTMAAYPPLQRDVDYYSASLILFSMLANQESVQ